MVIVIMKRIILTIVLLCATFPIFTQSISKEVALNTAVAYNDLFYKSGNNRNAFTIKELSLFNEAMMYLVSMDDGWILLSSEKATTPILASSPQGNFPTLAEMPCGMRWLMEYYEKSIKYAKDSLPTNVKDSLWDKIINKQYSIRSANDSVILWRMGSVRWNQSHNNNTEPTCDNSYNMFCPTWYTPKCDHTYVGCTAVAMAQVLWFWQWPYSAIIPDSINQSGEACSGRHIVKYDWSDMPGDVFSYTPLYQAEYVAELLRDCGYASKMKYGATSSGASFNDATNALKNTFHYKAVNHIYRNWYIGDWINRIKENINYGRPVIYAGYRDTDGAGHAFVIYGYRDNSFKINWGYSGEGNSEWYTLQTLNPINVGNGPFTNNQEALFEIEPDYPNCTEYAPSVSEFNQDFFQIYNRQVNISNKTIQFNKTGVVYAQDEIRLTGNVHIQQGANVHLAIKNMHCDNRGNYSNDNNNTNSEYTNRMMPTKHKYATQVSISPNPATDFVTISFTTSTNDKTFAIQIHDVYGNLICEKTQYPLVEGYNQIKINSSSYPSGLYIATIMIADETQTVKFLKQ